MSADADIILALVKRLEGFTAASPVPTPVQIAELGGEPFTEPSKEKVLWIEPKVFPNVPGRVSAKGDVANYRGYLQAMCCINKGKYALYYVTKLAGQVAAHFPKALLMTENGVTVKVSRDPGVASVIEDDGKIKVPVAIYYQAIA